MENKAPHVIDANMVLILKALMAANRNFKVELKVMENRFLATKASREKWIMVTTLPLIRILDEICEECV